MGDLTKNLSRHEFACHCCGIDNISLRQVEAVQKLRDLADGPVKIISGCRCPLHNLATGGEAHSEHITTKITQGSASDVVFSPRMSLAKMYTLALLVKEFKNGGIGLYPQADPPFMHVDSRGHPARWGKVDGEYCSLETALRKAQELEV